MIDENTYYARAFQYLRGNGYVYEGSGTYTKNGQRFRVRTFAEWDADKAGGYACSVEATAA